MSAASKQLLIEIEQGKGLPLRELTSHVPSRRRGCQVHVSCVLRWILDGVKLPGGEVVRLEAARLAGRWLSTMAAVSRFIERQTPHLGGDGAELESVERREARTGKGRAAANATKELEAAGI